jgi:hypothetical protein
MRRRRGKSIQAFAARRRTASRIYRRAALGAEPSARHEGWHHGDR